MLAGVVESVIFAPALIVQFGTRKYVAGAYWFLARAIAIFGAGAADALQLIAWRFFRLDAVAAFWFAYIVTRPLGASFADWFSMRPIPRLTALANQPTIPVKPELYLILRVSGNGLGGHKSATNVPAKERQWWVGVFTESYHQSETYFPVAVT